MKFPRLSRRQFLAAALFAAPAAMAGDAIIEPTWLKISRLRVGTGPTTHRLVHFTDLHHKGDREYLQQVVATINSLKPDFVCFTGDLLEDKQYLDETLELLAGIQYPLYGVPGNHDYWSRMPFGPVQKCFAKTGGAWLLNEQRITVDGKVNIMGLTSGWKYEAMLARVSHPPQADLKNIMLMHYPAWAKQFGDRKMDLLLAGHSHGGQVRLPLIGSLVTPFGVDGYDLGYFDSPAGPLYVGSGIGWFHLEVRFNCRPEITLIEV